MKVGEAIRLIVPRYCYTTTALEQRAYRALASDVAGDARWDAAEADISAADDAEYTGTPPIFVVNRYNGRILGVVSPDGTVDDICCWVGLHIENV